MRGPFFLWINPIAPNHDNEAKDYCQDASDKKVWHKSKGIFRAIHPHPVGRSNRLNEQTKGWDIALKRLEKSMIYPRYSECNSKYRRDDFS